MPGKFVSGGFGAPQLFLKDLRLLFGSSRLVVSCGGLALLFVVVGSFAFRNIGYGEAELRNLTPGILWLVFLFSGVVSLNHAFLPEREEGALIGVLLSPVSSGTVYLSKFLSSLLFVFTIQLLVIVLQGLFFWGGLFGFLLSFVLIALLFAVGFVALGTLLSSISVVVKEREILLPMILFPLCVPLVIGCIEVSRAAVVGGGIQVTGFWFTLVVVFDLISLTLSWALFEPLVQS